jgi:hypothetical protein
MSKVLPKDFPYDYIPMGLTWMRARKAWLVRRHDKVKKVERQFQSYEEALECWNETFSDKKAPLRPGERPFILYTEQRPIDKKPKIEEYISQQIEELTEKVNEVVNQMDRFLNHIIKNEDLFDFVNGTGKFYPKPQEEFPVLEEVKD